MQKHCWHSPSDGGTAKFIWSVLRLKMEQTKQKKRFAFPFFFLPADDNKLPVGRLRAADDIKPRSLAGQTGGWKVITQLLLSGRLWSPNTLVPLVTVRLVHS